MDPVGSDGMDEAIPVTVVNGVRFFVVVTVVLVASTAGSIRSDVLRFAMFYFYPKLLPVPLFLLQSVLRLLQLQYLPVTHVWVSVLLSTYIAIVAITTTVTTPTTNIIMIVAATTTTTPPATAATAGGLLASSLPLPFLFVVLLAFRRWRQ